MQCEFLWESITVDEIQNDIGVKTVNTQATLLRLFTWLEAIERRHVEER